MAAYASITSSVTKFALTSLMLVALTTGAEARGWFGADKTSSEASIALTDLPVQGQRTYQAILDGGPFRYDKDGTVFGNRERILPAARRGHYREYTVPTPGARNRGARRIVCGGEQRTAPEACWYTADHYASFRRIAP
ncbi:MULTISPECIES: ribonuclease domain-containing protein [Variovorax]|jgi:ribonuclease T1|uniref:Guanine-specific ribonuclease N1 and T1 n=2 Tax=Pseudomonadota TaxID=1224 RepID=A0A1E7TYH9_9BURK|nr:MULTISPECIES: ribonuclease domain-containing protein [Variovorax]ATA57487.1 guanine-specific ribonuclease N1 and T1 [Variovorax boronicumulans]KQX91342.1 guanine-specific ribonuclease N1 and T1 [Variovorax sp. Root473]MDP9881604.1 ribonuclease T1 [Variovorax boronicumulans]MDP9911714.1 ribonuclease T1 [Variovorax boronicumulans]MDP9914793.1 ribonuclease T1 [Variovorax boronicumulans]